MVISGCVLPKENQEDGVYLGNLRFHFLDLVLGVAVVTLLFVGTRVLVFTRGTFMVFTTRLGGTVKLIFTDSRDLTLRSVLTHLQRFHQVRLEHCYRSSRFQRLMVSQSNKTQHKNM